MILISKLEKIVSKVNLSLKIQEEKESTNYQSNSESRDSMSNRMRQPAVLPIPQVITHEYIILVKPGP